MSKELHTAGWVLKHDMKYTFFSFFSLRAFTSRLSADWYATAVDHPFLLTLLLCLFYWFPRHPFFRPLPLLLLLPLFLHSPLSSLSFRFASPTTAPATIFAAAAAIIALLIFYSYICIINIIYFIINTFEIVLFLLFLPSFLSFPIGPFYFPSFSFLWSFCSIFVVLLFLFFCSPSLSQVYLYYWYYY